MRFVSWNSSNDIGHSGINNEMKYEIINKLSKYCIIRLESWFGLKIITSREHTVITRLLYLIFLLSLP